MKKPIEMKKVIVAALILSITLLIFPLSSFGKGAVLYDRVGDIYRHVGVIEDLVFDFGPGLPVELPGLDEFGLELDQVTVTYVEVEAWGSEKIVLTPSGRYIYHATLWKGIGDSDKGRISAFTEELGWLVFEFKSAKMFEHFIIEGEIPEDPLDIEVPEYVNLFFQVKKATLIEVCWSDGCMDIGDVEPFNLKFELKDGGLVFMLLCVAPEDTVADLIHDVEDMDVPESAEKEIGKSIRALNEAFGEFNKCKIDKATRQVEKAIVHLMKAQKKGVDTQDVILSLETLLMDLFKCLE